jgi:HEAT repeat protein
MDPVALVLGAAAVAVPAWLVWRGWRRRTSWAEVAVDGFPEGLSAAPAAGVRGLPTGDPAFDAAVALGGDEARWLCLATPEVRQGLRAACGLGLALRDGAVRGQLERTRAAAVQPGLQALVTAFGRSSTLVHRFDRESEVGVRRRLFEVGLRGEAREPLLAHAAIDRDPAFRVWSAEVRAEPGALVALASDPVVPVALRERAFAGAGALLPREELVERLLGVDGPGRALARAWLRALPLGPWADAVVDARLAGGGDAADAVAALLQVLAEADAATWCRGLFPRLPDGVARRVLTATPAHLLTPAIAAAVEGSRPDLGLLLRSVVSQRHRDTAGPDLSDTGRLFEGTGLTWSPVERRAVAVFGARTLVVVPGAGRSLFRLSPVPMPARLVIHADRRSEVPGTPAALAWFPQPVRDLLRTGLPAGDELGVEDGELRLRALPANPTDITRHVAFLLELADALDALGPLGDADRIALAFRCAEPGPVRRKLAATAFEGSPELARQHLADADPDVRRSAGRHAPHAPTLVALVADRALPIPVRAVALTDLRALGDRDALEAATSAVWADEELVEPALVVTQAERLRGQWRAVVALVERLAPPGCAHGALEQERVRRALYVLTALDEPGAEWTIVRATASADPALRRAALTALGRFGTPAVLPSLLHHPDATDQAVVTRAIVALRDRLGTGGLSLSEATGGGVSVADVDGAGALAEAPAAPLTDER